MNPRPLEFTVRFPTSESRVNPLFTRVEKAGNFIPYGNPDYKKWQVYFTHLSLFGILSKSDNCTTPDFEETHTRKNLRLKYEPFICTLHLP